MMSSQEYLQQAYLLELIIDETQEKIEYWKEKSESVASISFERHYSTNRSTEAPFQKALKQMYEYEERLNEELTLLFALKNQIDAAISKVDDRLERLVLTYRYIKGYTWKEIADILNYSNSNVRKIHDDALANFKVPDDAISL